MRKPIYTLAGLLCLAPVTLLADDEEQEICNGGVQPILSVADFNGDGTVTEKDITIIKKAVKKENYYAFYDVNLDGKLDRRDIRRAKHDLGLSSNLTEQLLAYLFHRTKQYQLIDSPEEMMATGFSTIADSIAGHGQHWIDFVDPVEGNFWRPNGLNFSKNDQTVKGVFWSKDAIPVFENGATDYPTPGGLWETQRVIAFADTPPIFTGDPSEVWHTHAGLCITAEGTFESPVISLNQHTTFAECQALPSIYKVPGTNYNPWFNQWMLHAWMFDLNPNGIFGNTHPCVDPQSPDEATINGDRPVPPFFQHHH